MSEAVNRQWRLVARPTGMVQTSDFEYREEPVPVVGEGDYLLRTLYVSVDPAQRGWMNEDPGYMPPIPLGEVMRGGTLSEVVESRDSAHAVGEIVSGFFGWQEYALGSSSPMGGQTITPEHPLPRYLGVLGGTGLTAYFGLLDVGQAKPGQTILVSGAAGATGSVAAQIAKSRGAASLVSPADQINAPGLRVTSDSTRQLTTSANTLATGWGPCAQKVCMSISTT